MTAATGVRTLSGCGRCRRFAVTLTDGTQLTELQQWLIHLIHGGHNAPER